MKTKFVKNAIHNLSKKLLFFCISMAFTALISCSHEDAGPDLPVEEEESATAESLEAYYFDDADEVAMEAFVTRMRAHQVVNYPRIAGLQAQLFSGQGPS